MLWSLPKVLPAVAISFVVLVGQSAPLAASGVPWLSMPFGCQRTASGIVVWHAPKTSHRILGQVEREHLSVCAPDVHTKCRSIEVVRFELLCGKHRVGWHEVAAAIAAEAGEPTASRDAIEIAVPRHWVEEPDTVCRHAIGKRSTRLLPPPMWALLRRCHELWLVDVTVRLPLPWGFAAMGLLDIRVDERPVGNIAAPRTKQDLSAPRRVVAVAPPLVTKPLPVPSGEPSYREVTTPMLPALPIPEPSVEKGQLIPAVPRDEPQAIPGSVTDRAITTRNSEIVAALPTTGIWTIATVVGAVMLFLALLWRRRRKATRVERVWPDLAARAGALRLTPGSASRSLIVSIETPALLVIPAPRTAPDGAVIGGVEAAMPQTPRDALQVLRLSENDHLEPDTIKRRIAILRQRWHPDLARDARDLAIRNVRIRQVNAAAEILSSKRHAPPPDGLGPI